MIWMINVLNTKAKDGLFKSVRVDTIYLVAPVMKSEFHNKVFPKFNFIKDKYFDYIYKESNFTIKFNPIDIYGRPLQTKLMRQHWTLKIELQHEALKNMPNKVKQLLQQFDWKISQIELAFDFNTPFSTHFIYTGKAKAYYKFKNKKGEKKDCGQNYYLYADSAEQRALIYNKKKQLHEVKGDKIDESYLLRYEITIKPKQGIQQPIHKLQFDWIDQYLDKFIFVPNMRRIPKLKEDTYKLMRKVMRRRAKDYKGISDRQRDNIKLIAEQNKFDFVGAFQQNVDKLFDWIPKRIEAKAE